MSTTSLTVREVARRVGRSEETVRRWIWAGRLAATKRGNVLYVAEPDLDALGPSPDAPAASGPTLEEWVTELDAWRTGRPLAERSAAELVLADRVARDDGR